MKDTYTFPCVFIYGDEDIDIYFPDLDGCISGGNDEREAWNNAKEALCLHLYGMEADNDEIPNSSALMSIDLDENERAVLVEVFMPSFRAKQANKLIKKTLTIPHWLNIEAERVGVNFSQTLQRALKEELQIAQ